MFWTYILVLVLCVLMIFPFAHSSQAGSILDPVQPTLSTTPQFPGLGDTVNVSLSTFGITMTGASIVWSVDGVEQKESKNARSIVVRTKENGKPSTVTATVIMVNGKKLSATRTIHPGNIDLVAEPETYTPLSYQGRALPSAGSVVRVVAIPTLYSNGKRVPASELMFTWSQDGAVLFGGPVTGKEEVTIVMPRFSGTTVTVTAQKTDGSLRTQNSLQLQSVRPLVLFYEESTLYGTLLSAPSTFVTPKEEMTVRAVPYYTPGAPRGGGALTYHWTVDGKRVEPTSSDPYTLTLKRVAEAVHTTIGFSYQSSGGTLEYGQGAVDVSFTAGDFVNL